LELRIDSADTAASGKNDKKKKKSAVTFPPLFFTLIPFVTLPWDLLNVAAVIEVSGDDGEEAPLAASVAPSGPDILSTTSSYPTTMKKTLCYLDSLGIRQIVATLMMN
jgi:hypothetical protein